jgi:U-box domain
VATRVPCDSAVVAATEPHIPDQFICAIGYEVMVDPVICSDGHTYERANIEQWLKISGLSPKTNLPLVNKTLIPNYALKQTIEDTLLRNAAAHL